MSGSTATLPRHAPVRGRAIARSVASRTPWALVGCLLAAGLSLAGPDQPTYDPWSWIVWGREILHLDLTTSLGPSWKPLPVAMTTVFALFGSAAPLLWVLAARVGAAAAVLWSFRLGRRLGGPWAGGLAATALLLAPWFVRDATLANSEGLQIAFALAAIDRGLAGRHRLAFGLAVGLGLLRPEAWPFILAYAAWLAWRRRERLWVLAAGLVALPALWLVPEKLGSGDWLRAAHRAQQPVDGTPADAASPLIAVAKELADMVGTPLGVAFAVAAAAALWRRDRRLLGLIAALAAWLGLVGVMTSDGYSGNVRYVMVPAALAFVVAAAGVAAAAHALAGRWPSMRRAGPVVAVGLAAVVCGSWLGPARQAIAAAGYQADLVGQLDAVVRQAGGAGRVLACGPVATGAYLVPAVAWALDVHISDVELVPPVAGSTLRVRTTPSAAASPTLLPLAGAPVRTLAVAGSWRIVTTCGTHG